jgi:hypothetical protein
MTLYVRDDKYAKGKKLAESLEGEDGEFIRHYIKSKDEHIERLNDKIAEFSKALQVIGKYINR